MIFILCFVNAMYHIDWFADTDPFLHPWHKSQFIMMYDPFNVLLDSVCLIFYWGFLHLYLSWILAYNFFYLFISSQVSIFFFFMSRQCWICRMNLQAFFLFPFLEIVWERLTVLKNILWHLPVKPSDSGLLFVRRFLFKITVNDLSDQIFYLFLIQY